MTYKIKNIKARKQLLSYTCGVASLRTIFYFYKKNISEQELINKGNVKKEGLSHYQMRKLSRLYDFKCYTKSNASVKDLEYWLEQDIPVIVNYQDSESPNNGYNGHYAVLYGYDDNWFYIADPANYYEGDGKKFAANRKIERSNFISRWWDVEENEDESRKWFMIIRSK